MTFFNSTCRAVLMATAGCIAVASPALAEDGLSFDSDGATLEAGPLELTLGGRLHLDAMTYDSGAVNASDAAVRRARLELSGKITDAVRFRVDREFAGTDGWRNAWVSLRPAKGLEITGGNFTVPFSLEEAQSSNAITFVERSPISALAPGFGLGVAGKVAQDNWTISGGYFDDALDDADGRTKERGRGFAGRATFAPLKARSQFLHLGAAYEHRSFRADEVLRFSYGMGSNLAPNLITTNTIAAPSELNSVGVEAAYAFKSLQVQGQFVSTSVSRNLAPELNYGAWYGQVSWMLTGQKYGYSRGSGAPSGPTLGKKGGVELAARYGQLDLDDASLDRGKLSSLVLGATWYINRNLRLMANYVRSERTDTLVSGDRSADLGVARFQVAF
ncbi:MAG: hypothetical protein RL268_776 [Pseudomonadota bacterium]